MKIKKHINNDLLCQVLAMVIGASFFLFSGGIDALNVSNIGFLMKGDASQYWVGWEFFRNSPLLQWPIGMNQSFGDGIGNSIVYTDSIPLFAIPFKYINFLLPDTFQYTGIWLTLCYALSSLFGYLCVSRIGGNRLAAMVSVPMFFIISMLTQRATGHFALAGQWIILASLFLFLTRPKGMHQWLFLVCVASLVHAYLLLMCLGFFAASLADRAYNDVINKKDAVSHLLITMLSVVFIMYSVGYFSVTGGGVQEGGFGIYKLNINGFINPQSPAFSSMKRALNTNPGENEGLNYIGMGGIVSVLIGITSVFIRPLKIMSLAKRNIFLILILSCFFVFAISNNISEGKNIVYHYKLPLYFENLANTFRASGRFGWTVAYASIIISLIMICRNLNKYVAITIIALCSAMQFHDGKNFPLIFNFYSSQYSFPDKDAERLLKITKEKSKLIAYNQSSMFDDWFRFAYVAAKNNQSVNFGYFARYNRFLFDQRNANEDELIKSGHHSNDSAYIFRNERDADNFSKITGLRSTKMSGYFIVM